MPCSGEDLSARHPSTKGTTTVDARPPHREVHNDLVAAGRGGDNPTAAGGRSCFAHEGTLTCDLPNDNLEFFTGTLTLPSGAKVSRSGNETLLGRTASSFERSRLFFPSTISRVHLSSHQNGTPVKSHHLQVRFQSNEVEWNRTQVSLSAKNLLLRGCMLRQTEWVVGVVVYAGAETKIQMNASEPPRKESALMKYTNAQTRSAVLVMAAFCLFGGVAGAIGSRRAAWVDNPFLSRDSEEGNIVLVAMVKVRVLPHREMTCRVRSGWRRDEGVTVAFARRDGRGGTRSIGRVTTWRNRIAARHRYE